MDCCSHKAHLEILSSRADWGLPVPAKGGRVLCNNNTSMDRLAQVPLVHLLWVRLCSRLTLTTPMHALLKHSLWPTVVVANAV